jgi:hypothetical protein
MPCEPNGGAGQAGNGSAGPDRGQAHRGPPAGARVNRCTNCQRRAERYRALLDLGDHTGVVPPVEVWGGSKNLHRLGQSMFVVIESGHPKACCCPMCITSTRWLGLSRPQDDQQQNDPGVSPERTIRQPAARDDPRRRSRHAGDGNAPLTQTCGTLRQRQRSGPFAGAVQPGILGEGPA